MTTKCKETTTLLLETCCVFCRTGEVPSITGGKVVVVEGPPLVLMEVASSTSEESRVPDPVCSESFFGLQLCFS